MKPTLTVEIKKKFSDYHRDNLSWGVFHIVLADGNVTDDSVRFCKKYCTTPLEKELYNLLIEMSKTQRLKIGKTL